MIIYDNTIMNLLLNLAWKKYPNSKNWCMIEHNSKNMYIKCLICDKIIYCHKILPTNGIELINIHAIEELRIHRPNLLAFL